MNLGDRFKKFRQSIDMTQSELSEPYNCTRQIVSLIESNKSKPNLQFLYQLAKDYDLNIHWLITGEGQMFENNPPNSKELNEQAAECKYQEYIRKLEQEVLSLQRKLIICQEELLLQKER